ncbi:hypothetical protein PRIC2_008961 [Phytophthora ramorum]
MRRHFLFAEDEKERSVGDGKANLLRLWHNRRNAMLEGDESADGGEANNALVGRELTLLWDLAKPLNSRTLQRDGYVEFFARAGKALVLPLSTDAIAILAARRDWEYDLEGVGSVNESTKAASSLDAEVMSAVQFREAVMQLAEIILPVESAPSVFAAFFRDLRNSVAELAASPSGREPEQDETNSTEPVDRFTLRPLNRIPKIANDAFLQKLPPSSEALRSIRGLQSPDQREMSLKQLLLCYNPRKFSLTRAFSKKKGSDTKVAEEAKADTVDTPQPDVEDEMAVAKRLHLELMGSIGSGATPVRGRKLHRETAAHRNPEDALIAALTEFPALRIAVVGPPGCGKTRLARVLAQRLGLRYLSLDGVIQRAVDHKLRIRRRRPAVIIPVEGEDSAVETPLEMETVEADEEIDTDNAGEDESIDQVFRDEDLDALCAGGVVTRSKALDLFRLEATRSLLAGVGVIMDDVYPCELSISDNPGHSIAVDYLIALTALPTEIEHQLQGSQLAPAAGRLYSVRELATLKATHAEGLVAEGFADCLQPPKKPEVDAEEVQEPNGSTANGDAGASSEDQEVDESPSPEENDEEGDGGQVLSEEPVLPPEPTPAERNEIEPPGERTLPFGSIAMAKFTKGYHEYVTRMQRELLTRRVADSTEKRSDCHLVVALSTQSLNVIRDHCIQTITGTPLGLSRFSTSREACQVSLPENLNGSSRAEKVRWLLYGDWAALLEAEASSTTESFARLPRRDAKRRLLSKWREFCPVVSTSVGALTLGDPEFAACYSGRVYLLASQEARRAFCAYPLQFLLREIPIPSKCRNFWLVTTGAGDAFTPSYLEALEAGLHVQTVSTSKLLKTSPSIAMEMRLMSGQIVSPVEAAAIASDAAKTLLAKQNASSGWMLMDLPLTRDVAAALLEHGCVPDAILLLDREVAAVQEDGEGSSAANMSALSALRRQQFQTEKAGAEDVSQGIGGVTRVITCPLFRQPSDTLAAIERELNPIAPRLDRIEDGHAPELVDEYDPTVIFASPLPENDEVNEGKSTSTSEEGDEVDVTDPEAEAQAKAARSRALQLQGECGHFCPVTWHTRGLLIPGLPTNVCLFRQKFYAFAGEQERLAFERNPATFIPNGPRSTTNFVPCVLVLGVRGSGRGRVTAALAKSQSDSLVEYLNLDLTVVANRAERRRLLEELKPEEARMTSEEMFVESLQLELKRQEPTPKKAVARIIAGLGSEPSRIPTTAMLEMCFKHGLVPALVVPLTVSEDDVVNTLLDRWAASLPTPRRKLALMRKKEAGAEGEDDTVPEDEAEEEEPPIDLEEAREEESTRLHEQFTEDQKALDEAIAGLRARGVVRTDEELQGRKHNIFQTFCPVELQAGKFYNSRQSSRDLCVDFRGCSFWLGSEQNLEQFVDNPEGFVGYLPEQTPLERGEESWPTQEDAESEAQTLVAKAPVNASLVSLLTVPDCDFPEMKGYCPVTFALGSGDKDWASLRHGSVFFRASYRSKVYFFVSEEARRKFCAEPSRYASQSLPVKLPPQVALAKSYPGQLEQKLGAALNEVLLALGCERPKFPQMPMRASACVYLALSLKALQRKYQLKVKPDPRSARDEDEPDEEQKQRQERREEQAERDATARRDAFVRDCRLGEQLKVASTPTHTSCGSGAKVARSMRAAHDSLAGNETESYISPAPANEEVDQLRHRFDAIVSGSSSADKTLSTDPRSARTHARAAFLEYIKPSTAI